MCLLTFWPLFSSNWWPNCCEEKSCFPPLVKKNPVFFTRGGKMDFSSRQLGYELLEKSELRISVCEQNTHCYWEKTVKIKKMLINITDEFQRSTENRTIYQDFGRSALRERSRVLLENFRSLLCWIIFAFIIIVACSSFSKV